MRCRPGVGVERLARACARAQATLAKKELAEQFNRVLEDGRARRAKERIEDAEKRASMAEALAALCVKLEVLLDIAVDVEGAEVGGVWHAMSKRGRREEVTRRCRAKQVEFESAGRA